MGDTTAPWFVCLRPAPQARLRLFCFPYAGGGAPLFRNWPDGLPGVEVWAAQLPGRGSRFREKALTAMPPLVQALAAHFAPDEDARPYAFFGHSMGGRLAFELTRALRRQGRMLPARLFVSACPAPQLAPERPPIHSLPQAAFLAELARRNGIPQELLAEQELLDLLLPMVRADFMAYETAVYESEPPLPRTCPIHAFGGVDDPLVSREALAAWQEQTAGTFQLSFFAGDHFFLRTAERELLGVVGRDCR